MIRFLIQLQRVINYKNLFLVCASFMAILTLDMEVSKARASHDWLHFSALTLVLVTMWLQAWINRKTEQGGEIIWAIFLGYMAVAFK